jgi:glycosyltransferase involved in cell wall biosynthesis
VHSHFGTNGVLIAPVCAILNIPLVVTFHGFDISSAISRYPGYKKSLIKLFDQIVLAIAISEEMKERLILLGCREEKIRVSYLGVPLNTDQFVNRNRKSKDVRYLHAGRLTAKKGVPDLIKSFEKIITQNKNAILDIVGEGEEMDLVKKTINDLNISRNVNLHGRVSDEKLIELRRNADVFVLNCRTDRYNTKEGLPISTLEAAATGLPAVSTIHAGIPESITDGETGFLVKECDNEALSDAMTKLLDQDTRLVFGSNARKFMEKKFDLEKCNLVLEQIYEEAIKKYTK